MTAEKDSDNASAQNAGGNMVTGGNNKESKLQQQQQMLGNLQQPLFQPLVKPVDAPTNELIRMLQAPQRINEKDSDLGLNGNINNKDVNQVSRFYIQCSLPIEC